MAIKKKNTQHYGYIPYLLSSVCCTSYYLHAIRSMKVSCGDAPVTTTVNILRENLI